MSAARPSAGPARCVWCGADPLYVAYHDDEWGVPVLDDRALYAKLMLDGFQAGLSWLIVLRKRATILEAFAGLDPERVARFGPADLARLLADPGVIRNRAKLEAAVSNAQAFLRLVESGTSFATLLWSFTGGRQLAHRVARDAPLPAQSPEGHAMARALGRLGFRFCGPTICYAFMQAVGMVNDHAVRCFRRLEVSALARAQLGAARW